MRATAIPAQVTTVEDRIVGNLSVSQLILLSAVVFGGGLLYALLPPMTTITPYKLVLWVVIGVPCALLAIRVKGAIMLAWVATLLQYWIRPRYYLFEKRSLHSREQYLSTPEVIEEETAKTSEHVQKASSLSSEEITSVMKLIENPDAHVAFEARKGGLYVRVTEIKQEG
jgi:hypothetical protein